MGAAIDTRVADRALEHIHFASDLVAVGTLQCGCNSSYFRGEQITGNYVIAFPRTPLWIRQDRGAPFVATSALATIYNRGQRFERRAIAPAGDTADWFALAEDVVRDIVAEVEPQAADEDAPLRAAFADIPPALYHRQRRLVAHTASHPDASGMEEQVIAVFAAVLHTAHRLRGASTCTIRCTRSQRAHRELVEQAKAVIAATCTQHLSLRDLAHRCETSVYHLCHTFRSVTGQTLQGFRHDLRLRAALDEIDAHRGRLSVLAHAMGFSSHAHFTAAYKRHFGVPPGCRFTPSIPAQFRTAQFRTAQSCTAQSPTAQSADSVENSARDMVPVDFDWR